jgi:putative cardiolipin synthase
MHNKSFTADSQATIIGGRNVADEYFAIGSNREFVDLDVLAVGSIAQEVERDFDRYWASESSYPAERIIPPLDTTELARTQAAVEEKHRSAAAMPYLRAVAERPFVRDLIAGTLALEWAVARLLSDDPAKVLQRAGASTLLWPQMKQALGPPSASLDLVSAYFVPTQTGTDGLAAFSREGVKVRVLTNSLEATDLAIVHAGYAKHRRALLSAGVELFEIKRQFAQPSVRGQGLRGSSSSSLHAKTFSVDRQRVFVGSFNFDPRSARLNTEMGLVIESTPLARQMDEMLANEIPHRAYQVRLTGEGKLEWIEQIDGQQVVHATEPGTGIGRRLLVAVLSWLPIDWLL